MDKLDNNWDLDGFAPNESSTWTMPVELIHLCALRNELNEGDEEGSPPTNHWTICLKNSSSSCVMLDVARGYGDDGLRGKIEVTALDTPYTLETLQLFTITPCGQQPAVGQILTQICSKGRQRFIFHPSFEGCRFWISVLVADWEDMGVVEAGSALMAREALGKYWVNPEGSLPRHMREGTFWTEDQFEDEGSVDT